MDECIFCRIADGEIPAHTFYEDGDVVAFLDANPVSEGHALVVPKEHAETLPQLSGESTDAVFAAVRDAVRTMQDELDVDGVNVLQNNGEAAGQEVPHVHVHVIPRTPGDGLELAFDQDELDDETAEELVARLEG